MANVLAVDIRNIYLTRGDSSVFYDFSWPVEQGQHWFIMGDNGCGKTSLLEIINGYLWPQKGEVRVLGELFGRTFLPDLRKRIGYISPWIFKRLYGKTTVCQVVASGVDGSVGYWGDIASQLRQRVLDQLGNFHADELIDRTFASLSSGQQFKVVFARAMINSPNLLLLDEPFAQMDIGSRIKAYQLIRSSILKDPDLSVILVTHHLEDISDFYTHGLLFKSGKDFVMGKKEEVLKDKVFKSIFDIAK